MRKRNGTGEAAPAQVVETVQRRRESGLSQSAFCRRERIPEWKLSAWKKQVGCEEKISQSRSAQVPTSVQFAAVTVVAAAEHDPLIPSAESASPLKLPALDILVVRVPEGST